MSESIPAYTRPCADPIVEAVRDLLRQRSLAGQAKYHASMDRGDLSLKDWLRHAQEEALDLAVYLERLLREPSPPVPTPGWWYCEWVPGTGWRWTRNSTGPMAKAPPPNGWEAA